MAELTPAQLAPLVRSRPPQRALEWVRRAVAPSARVVAVRRLRGGVSGAIHRIDLRDARGRVHRLVLRRFTRPDWGYPGLAEREADALRALAGSDVPAPRLIAVDPYRKHCDVPALLSTFLPGRPDYTPADWESWLAQLAGALPAVHAVDPCGARIRRYRPYHEARSLDVPPWSKQPRAWRAIIDRLLAGRPRAPRRFIHRDYHQANVLWQRGRLTGIVDWPNASMGPADVDAGYCRQNLVRSYSVELADRFLQHYLAAAGRTPGDYDPYWDAITLSDILPEPNPLLSWAAQPNQESSRAAVRRRLDRYAAAIARRL